MSVPLSHGSALTSPHGVHVFRRRHIRSGIQCVSLIFAAALFQSAVLLQPVWGQTVRRQAAVSFKGMLAEDTELSGIAIFGDLLVVVPDEGTSINVLKKSGSGEYDLLSVADLKKHSDGEIDMEGAASDSEYVYVVGSHSRARKKVDESHSYNRNLERIADVEERPDADALFRLKLDANGKVASEERISLREVLDADDILKRFGKIPSKENGIDIEGVAVKDGRLYLGFRGPVLRENFVPILTFKFDEPERYDLLFVQLGGRGIRDMAAVANGFLILAGAVGDGEESFRLYHWNGSDCIPGSGAPGGSVQLLGDIPAPDAAKAEGLVLLESTAQSYRFMIIYDGRRNGAAAEMTAASP